MSEVIEFMPVPKYGPVEVRLLAIPRYILTHYSAKTKSRACPGESCSDHNRPILKGYAPALAWNAEKGLWMPIVHEMTEAAIDLVGLEPLLGVCWRFQRVNKGKKVREVVGVQLESEPLSCLPDPWCVVANVERVFRTSRIEWDVSPLLFAKIRAQAVSGPAPPQSTKQSVPELPILPANRIKEILDGARSDRHEKNGSVR